MYYFPMQVTWLLLPHTASYNLKKRQGSVVQQWHHSLTITLKYWRRCVSYIDSVWKLRSEFSAILPKLKLKSISYFSLFCWSKMYQFKIERLKTCCSEYFLLCGNISVDPENSRYPHTYVCTITTSHWSRYSPCTSLGAAFSPAADGEVPVTFSADWCRAKTSVFAWAHCRFFPVAQNSPRWRSACWSADSLLANLLWAKWTNKDLRIRQK